MRCAALVLLVLLAPTTEAASGVHVAWRDDGFDVIFQSDQPAPVVRWQASGASGDISAHRRDGPVPNVWEARLPVGAVSYSIEGASFPLRAPPARNDAVRVVFVADSGRTSDSWRVLDAIQAEKPDLVLVGGDLSYANGHDDAWDAWLDRWQPLAASAPTMTARGNHETTCESASGSQSACAREAAEYAQRFGAPSYAFDWGPARFTVLDTEAYHASAALDPFNTDARAQTRSLQESLAHAGPAWSVVLFHRPLYSSNAHDDGADAAAHDDLVPALDAGGADLVLYGHAHAYERSWPLRGDRVVSHDAAIHEGDGVFYVDSGGGGQSLYTDFAAQPAWSAVRTAAFEYVVMEINATRLDVTAKQPDGTVLDHFVIARGALPLVHESTQRVPGAELPLVVGVVLFVALGFSRSVPKLRFPRILKVKP